MANSLGLLGDLDDVDLIEDVEAAFDISFSDEKLETCITVGDLFAQVEERLDREAETGKCAMAMCWFRLRRLIEDQVGQGVTPATPISVFSKTDLRSLEKAVKEATGIALPTCTPSSAISLLFGTMLASGAAVWLVDFPFLGAVGLTTFAWTVARRLPLVWPADISTVGELIEMTTSRNIGLLAASGGRLGTEDAWVHFLRLIADHTALPEIEISKSTLLLESN